MLQSLDLLVNFVNHKLMFKNFKKYLFLAKNLQKPANYNFANDYGCKFFQDKIVSLNRV